MKETRKVTEVKKSGDYYSISCDGSGFGLSTEYGVEPKVGDNITLHIINGSMIRGVDLNGEKVFYKTDDDLEQERKEFVVKLKKEREEQFLKEKDRLDEDFISLPKMFQEKIQQKRNDNPNYRIESESYEMFCYKQAIEIANGLPKFEGVPELNIKERIQKFYDMPYEEQKKAIPKLSEDHSGNTFGAACGLAAQYLSSAEFASSKIKGLQESKDVAKKGKYSI